MSLRCENTECSFTGKERSYMNEWLHSLVWKATLSSQNQENEVCLVEHSIPISVLFALFLHLPSLRDHTLKVLWPGHWVKTSYKLNVQRVPGIFWEEKMPSEKSNKQKEIWQIWVISGKKSLVWGSSCSSLIISYADILISFVSHHFNLYYCWV